MDYITRLTAEREAIRRLIDEANTRLAGLKMELGDQGNQEAAADVASYLGEALTCLADIDPQDERVIVI